MMRLFRQRVMCCLLTVAALLPGSAAAMRQCPPEFGDKSPAFLALGMGMLALGVAAGLWAAFWIACKMYAKRVTGLRMLPWLLLAVVVMTAIWCATLLVYLGVFVLPC